MWQITGQSYHCQQGNLAAGVKAQAEEEPHWKHLPGSCNTCEETRAAGHEKTRHCMLVLSISFLIPPGFEEVSHRDHVQDSHDEKKATGETASDNAASRLHGQMLPRILTSNRNKDTHEEHHRGMAQSKEESRHGRAFLQGGQPLGNIVDGCNVICVNGMSQPDRIR